MVDRRPGGGSDSNLLEAGFEGWYTDWEEFTSSPLYQLGQKIATKIQEGFYDV
jgi:hypothetical protein